MLSNPQWHLQRKKLDPKQQRNPPAHCQHHSAPHPRYKTYLTPNPR